MASSPSRLCPLHASTGPPCAGNKTYESGARAATNLNAWSLARREHDAAAHCGPAAECRCCAKLHSGCGCGAIQDGAWPEGLHAHVVRLRKDELARGLRRSLQSADCTIDDQ